MNEFTLVDNVLGELLQVASGRERLDFDLFEVGLALHCDVLPVLPKHRALHLHKRKVGQTKVMMIVF